MPYFCYNCGQFWVKKGTVLERSHTSYQKVGIGTYLMTANPKGITSMKIHRDRGMTQKSTRFMVPRLRESWRKLARVDKIDGPAEID